MLNRKHPFGYHSSKETEKSAKTTILTYPVQCRIVSVFMLLSPTVDTTKLLLQAERTPASSRLNSFGPEVNLTKVFKKRPQQGVD